MGSTEATELELWSHSLTGDSLAFGTLFDRHRDRVFAHALRLVDLPADAEDVTAIAFLELWRRRNAVRVVNDSILPWLLVTTTNASRNTLRSRHRYRRFLSTLPPALAEPDIHEHIAERIDGEPRRRELRQAIAELSPADRNLLILVDFEGFTLHDASETLSLSYGATKTRLSRARARLRHALGEDPPAVTEEGIAL